MKTLSVGIYADRHFENVDRVQITRNRRMLSHQLPTRARIDQNGEALCPWLRSSMNFLRGFRSPMSGIHI